MGVSHARAHTSTIEADVDDEDEDEEAGRGRPGITRLMMAAGLRYSPRSSVTYPVARDLLILFYNG